MSARAQGEAWGNLDALTAAQSLVALAVADVVNDAHGNEFWMTSKALATKVGMGDRNARHRLAELVTAGWVDVIEERPGHPTKYRWVGSPRPDQSGPLDPGVGSLDPPLTTLSITQPNPRETQSAASGDVGPPAPAQQELGTPTAESPQIVTQEASRQLATTARSVTVEVLGRWLAVPLTFDGFWSIYPRKTGKGTARRAWERAVRGAPSPTLRAGQIVAAIARMMPTWRQTEVGFIPHPTTWLNGERWDDEPDATVEQQRRASVANGADQRARNGQSLAFDPTRPDTRGAIDV